MKRKNRNFCIKKMQKPIMLLFGVFTLAVVFCGCTKKNTGELLLPLEEQTESEADTLTEANEEPEADFFKQTEEAAAAGNADTLAEQDGTKTEPSGQAPVFFYVHVCGAVEEPGVYELSAGSRVYEAVALAGGFTEDAARDYVNQAQAVPDAAKIVIPTVEEAEALRAKEADSSQYGMLTMESAVMGTQAEASTCAVSDGISTGGLVNLNTAGKAELCTLPGIGETKADAIIQYRSQIGCFTSKEQLMEIAGIKEALYTKLQDRICVN